MPWLQIKSLPMVEGKWLVSKILHSTPISRMTLISLGPLWVRSERHVSIFSIATFALHYNNLFTHLLNLKAGDRFISHHASVQHILYIQTTKRIRE